MSGRGGDHIRRLILAAGVITLAFAVTPRTSSAAFSLALARGDYPRGSQITGLPATNHEVTVRLGPLHRSSFDRLHRVDGDGWLQAAVWHFTTGRGATRWRHRTIFLYAINVFHNGKQAQGAVADEKIGAHAARIGHLPCRWYQVSDVHGTLVVALFSYADVEVEAYYEYKGVAPAATAASIRHDFGTQTSHLAAFARRLHALNHRKPTPTPRPVLQSTATPVPADTATPTPSASPIPAASDTPTAPVATPTATSTATPAPPQLVIRATPANPSYAAGQTATILVNATLDGHPAVNALVNVSFFFPGNTAACAATVDESGNASCAVRVPIVAPGTIVQVNVRVSTTTGVQATADTSFTIRI